MFVIVVVDDDVVEALDIFKERLETLVPLGGGLVQKNNALVDEAELDVRGRELAAILRQLAQSAAEKADAERFLQTGS